ncbi:MAG: helix-turn-helix transcriptional regulator [Nannocystaceae bacterium]|nr:helix-turn-helix transcriptional regulator [Nannocystaceae bacterium]
MALGRPLQFDPDVAVDAAMQLFWRKGYESTSLRDLLAAMDLSKSSFYQAFESKDALFLRCLEHYEATGAGQMREDLRQAESGWAFLGNWLSAAAHDMRGRDGRRGCMLVNTAGEFGQSDTRIASQVSTNFAAVAEILTRAIRMAQREGEVPKNKDPATLATYLISSMSGLRTLVKSGADRKTVQTVATIVRNSLV